MSSITTTSLVATAIGLTAVGAYVASHRSPDAPPPPETPTALTAPTPETDDPEDRPLVQLALLLDTSGSMDGLINQARSQLWSVVNRLSEAKRDGVRPRLELALYEYGNDAVPHVDGWIRQVLPFTSELDRVSEELFALSTNGGTELAPRAVATAVEQLEWSEAPGALKLLYIAGNEEFNQGEMPPEAAARAASAKGVIVNTIYCAPANDSLAHTWNRVARLAKGSFFSLDHNQAIVRIETPFDDELEALNLELNQTYMPYGARGQSGMARQQAQDSNARKMGKMASRATSKGGALYSNSSWDLVDAVDRKQAKLEQLKDADLPAELRGKSKEEQKVLLQTKRDERAKLKRKIAEVAKKREKVVAQERAKQKGDKGLDALIVESLSEQGSKVGLAFE